MHFIHPPLLAKNILGDPHFTKISIKCIVMCFALLHLRQQPRFKETNVVSHPTSESLAPKCKSSPPPGTVTSLFIMEWFPAKRTEWK